MDLHPEEIYWSRFQS